MLTNYEKAIALTKIGCYVFPARSDNKRPVIENGHLKATQDPEQLKKWFPENKEDDRRVAVNAGLSNLVCIDVDVDPETGKDGWASLEDEWLSWEPTYEHQTPRGGTHLVYESDKPGMFGTSNYRKLKNVDRRAGSSYFVWWGHEVPETREAFSDPEEWMLDTKDETKQHVFTGDIQAWRDSVVPGPPSDVIKLAIGRIPADDMSHSQMVERQHEAIRLGAEGHPGAIELLDKVYEAFMNRPDTHTRPPEEWQQEWDEALDSGVQKYGAQPEYRTGMPEYSFDIFPPGLDVSRVTGVPVDKAGWSSVLWHLTQVTDDDSVVLSILWNSPATRDMSRKWGLEFTLQRIDELRKAQNAPVFENLETAKPPGSDEPTGTVQLLEDYELEALKETTTFQDVYAKLAEMDDSFSNPTMTRAASWAVLSMVFGFRGFIPVSASSSLGLNLWLVSLSPSGSGKTFTTKQEQLILRSLFDGDNPDAQHEISGVVSPSALHEALIRRDGLATLLFEDEASGLFKRMQTQDYMSGLNDDLAKYYDGYVPPGTKISLKELRGKSARTSFAMHMHATPERFYESVTKDMFLSGFLARVNWSVTPPSKKERKVKFTQELSVPKDMTQLHPNIAEMVTDLHFMAHAYGGTVPVLADESALSRMESAVDALFRDIEGKKNHDIVQPAVVRLGYETIRKCAALSALWRGSPRIEDIDVFVALNAAQEWYDNLANVAEQVSSSLFAKGCDDIEAFIRSRGHVTREVIFRRFGDTIQKDMREIEGKLNFLYNAGRCAPTTENGKVTWRAL